MKIRPTRSPISRNPPGDTGRSDRTICFPRTEQVAGKLRPALVLRSCPGPHDDWLICMISAQLRHELPGIDEVVHATDSDFARTGLKLTSVIRATRLAVVAAKIMQGAIGTLGDERIDRIRERLADWISGSPSASPPR